eukprot:gnl/Dysnectes_brevis/3655_a4667_660.p1 GENE.gnl/Dysnectes_brevis/3655_a4667_660~~gnl/Dysnectes_brevis/3655_a4667_660.p1  ORF type:complete len:329 (+),score=71.58 gnl/Dysnectes_brevis/3655_a4667_660:101-1087(+)
MTTESFQKTDISVFKHAWTLTAHRGPIASVSFDTTSPYRFISASADSTASIYQLTESDITQEPKFMCRLTGHKLGLSDAIMVGNHALTAGDDCAMFWDVEKKTPLTALTDHSGWVTGCCITRMGMVTCSADESIRLWDIRSGQAVSTLRGHKGPVLSVALSSDGLRAVSGSADQTVKLWDLRNGQILKTAQLKGAVSSVALSPNDQYLLCGVSGFGSNLLDLSRSMTLIRAYKAPTRDLLVRSCFFNFNTPRTGRAQSIVTGTSDGQAMVHWINKPSKQGNQVLDRLDSRVCGQRILAVGCSSKEPVVVTGGESCRMAVHIAVDSFSS